jgi:hypothetical protein
MSLEANKIESCKRIVLWMLKDNSTLTTKQILTSFTTKEKKKRIKEALNELCSDNKIIKVKKMDSKESIWVLNTEVVV